MNYNKRVTMRCKKILYGIGKSTPGRGSDLAEEGVIQPTSQQKLADSATLDLI